MTTERNVLVINHLLAGVMLYEEDFLERLSSLRGVHHTLFGMHHISVVILYVVKRSGMVS